MAPRIMLNHHHTAGFVTHEAASFSTLDRQVSVWSFAAPSHETATLRMQTFPQPVLRVTDP